jgi:hypothetical protein
VDRPVLVHRQWRVGGQGEAAPAGPPTGVAVFAAIEAPDLLVDDVRAFFRSRR